MKKNATQQKKIKDSEVPSQTAINNSRFEFQNHKRNKMAIGLPGSISYWILLQGDWGFTVASWTKEAALSIQTIRETRGERGHHFIQPECVWCLLLPGLISLCRNRSPLCFPCPVFCFLHYFSLLDDYKRQGICFQSHRAPTKPNGNNPHPHKTQNKLRKGGNTLHWIFREQEFDVNVWRR